MRTLRDRLLPVALPDSDSVDHIALLGLVAQSSSLVRSRRARSSVDDVELAVFPAANAEEETEDVGLFLLVKGGDLDVSISGFHM